MDRHLIIGIILVFLVVVGIFTYSNTNKKEDVAYLKAGEISISVNELGELQFLDRNYGSPMVADSHLTSMIGNMIARHKYLDVNKK